MCGISGVVNCGDRETLARMTLVQSHRGPDDSGTVIIRERLPEPVEVGLGNRRLAILALSPLGER